MSFCFYCGHGPCHLLDDAYHCSICQAAFKIKTVKQSQITLEEAQAIFDKIPHKKKKGRRNIRYKSKDAPKQEIGTMSEKVS